MEWPLCACDSFAGWILHLTAVQLVFVGTINNEDCNLQGPSSVAYPKPALDPNAHGMRTCTHIHTHACAQVNTARARAAKMRPHSAMPPHQQRSCAAADTLVGLLCHACAKMQLQLARPQIPPSLPCTLLQLVSSYHIWLMCYTILPTGTMQPYASDGICRTT